MNSEPVNIFTSPFNLFPDGREIFEAFLDIPVSTFSIIIGLIFWLVLLRMPLSGIDRRDQTAGLTYALFMCFSGTILILAVGQPRDMFSGILTHLIVVLLIFGAAKPRWTNRNDRLKKYSEMSTEEAPK